MRILVNKLIMYSIILIVVFFYPELVGQRGHNVNDMRGINYIPKSKQTVYDRWMRSLKTWTRKLLRGLDNRIMSIKTPRTYQKRRYTVTRRERGMFVILAMSVIAMRAEGPEACHGEHNIRFDTDSEAIGVDNRCSGCISYKIEDFVGVSKDSHRTIKGFGGTRTKNIKIGTIK